MAEEKKDQWLNYLALSSVILALCATMSTFKGGGYSTRTILSQSQASDQWAFYQAKSLKSNLYDVQKQELEMRKNLLTSKNSPEQLEALEKRIEDYGKRIARYDEEKAQIEKEAKNLENTRDEATKHGQAFGVAVIFLQIAILLSSIAALMKKKYVWVLGLVTGAFGMVFFFNGFWLFF